MIPVVWLARTQLQVFLLLSPLAVGPACLGTSYGSSQIEIETNGCLSDGHHHEETAATASLPENEGRITACTGTQPGVAGQLRIWDFQALPHSPKTALLDYAPLQSLLSSGAPSGLQPIIV
ncbi:hypothetical protein BDP55DRAFT_626307 [Colletotrichum godetiae]|uniref:Uncharacterized protein n=1 Tax=Colletotrichum godetiae TaxID=1209918 RepID=A0AAJ0B1L0_9PEZI|nr:uncharacterized protein BDP55DRAFT_626307 [Colletotrichum godetiae]KAK1700763.1 hypothetical protein BDP55DRAFT_626307 [Colletotrichum godetiae]